MSTMLLSIKPEYAKVILDGQKEYEFRKRRCKTGVNKIVFYSTAPESKVVGEAEIEDIIEGSPSKIWELAKKLPELRGQSTAPTITAITTPWLTN